MLVPRHEIKSPSCRLDHQTCYMICDCLAGFVEDLDGGQVFGRVDGMVEDPVVVRSGMSVRFDRGSRRKGWRVCFNGWVSTRARGRGVTKLTGWMRLERARLKQRLRLLRRSLLVARLDEMMRMRERDGSSGCGGNPSSREQAGGEERFVSGDSSEVRREHAMGWWCDVCEGVRVWWCAGCDGMRRAGEQLVISNRFQSAEDRGRTIPVLPSRSESLFLPLRSI